MGWESQHTEMITLEDNRVMVQQWFQMILGGVTDGVTALCPAIPSYHSPLALPVQSQSQD